MAPQLHRRWFRVPFTVWVLLFAASGFWLPELYTRQWREWAPRHAIGPLVQLIMLGMGLTLSLADFARVARMPQAVLVGVVCQYAIMPAAGWSVARLFQLEGEVAAGLILVGSCPGGVASNVIAYLARANVPLSVTMTACSTLLAPLVTPLAMRWYAGAYVAVDAWALMGSIMQLILAPLAVGVLANHFFRTWVARATRHLPGVAMLAICLIIAITVALARDDLSQVALALLAAVACQNAVGFTLGYCAARGLGLDRRDSRTVALEVGLQNGGMATGLALNVLHSPAAALASAVFGPSSAVASSLLATHWRRHPVETAPSPQASD